VAGRKEKQDAQQKKVQGKKKKKTYLSEGKLVAPAKRVRHQGEAKMPEKKDPVNSNGKKI